MTLTLLVVAWLLTYLLHSSLLLGGAWLLAATGVVRSPLARDTLWKVCLVGGILTATVYCSFPYQPLGGSFLLPSVTASGPAASEARIESSTGTTARVRELAAPRSVGAALSTPRVSRTTSDASPITFHASPITHRASSATWPQALLGFWIVGAGVLLVRLFVLHLRLHRSLSRRREIIGDPLAAMLDSLKAAAGVRRPIRLTSSAELAGPVAMGASEICLPERALTALDAGQQRAVLAHELGHLVRQDPLWLGLAGACESFLFLQPLNRLARRRIQEAAEYLCDDWAVHQTGGSLTLAKCLAEVATWMDAGSRAVPVAGMAENRSQLVERVHRLLEGSQPSQRGFRMAVPVAALALASMAFAAPGVSPPCSEDAQAQAAHAQVAGSSAPAVWQGEPKTWATIRDGRVLTFRSGFAPRLTGQGHLGIRRGGRMIELTEGQRLLVNGREPSDGRIVEVCSSDTLRIVGVDGRTLWQVEPVRVAPQETVASADAEPSSGTWASAAARASAEARAESAAERAGERMDSLGDQLDALGDELDELDTRDVAEIARRATEVSSQVTSEVTSALTSSVTSEVTSAVTASILPQVARLQELGARLSAQVVGQVVPAIVQGLCDGGLCDDSAPPVKRHKTSKPRLP